MPAWPAPFPPAMRDHLPSSDPATRAAPHNTKTASGPGQPELTGVSAFRAASARIAREHLHRSRRTW